MTLWLVFGLVAATTVNLAPTSPALAEGVAAVCVVEGAVLWAWLPVPVGVLVGTVDG